MFAQRFAQVLYQCLEVVGSTKGALYLKDEDGFWLATHFGFPRLMPPPERFAPDAPLVKWIERERRIFAVNNASQFPELATLVQGAEAPRALFAPIYDKGIWIGFLVQRDRLRGEGYDVARDEAPTLAICQEIVEKARENRLSVLPAPRGPSAAPETPLPPPTLEEVTAFPVEVPPPDSMFPPAVTQDLVSGPRAERPATDDRSSESAPPPEVPRPGFFLPEQQTFFWEAASLLCSIVPLAAVALWMDEPHEVRPLLAYSRLPLGEELKQQILAHATYHITRVAERDLRLLAKQEWLEEHPLRGVFRTYLPVVLMEAGGGQDLLLLFRQEERPFSDEERAHIRLVARMLGFHLQEGRLHERYHRAFLSVAHRILSTGEGGSPALRTHSLNTARLARNFAVRLGLPSQEVEAVSISAILHDVGTLLLDPRILAKPQLDPEDLARVRTHPVLASAFLKDFHFPFDVLRIIRHHHERWDGQGYPDALKGEEIPVGSRIINIIESFEVMSSGHGYKAPKSSREILDELRREASSQFDPSLVNEFIDYLTSKARRVD